MDKQKEIREGIAGHLKQIIPYDQGYQLLATADWILQYLHSQGVVIKVDKLPEYDNYNDLTRELDSRVKYVAVEPLVGNENKV